MKADYLDVPDGFHLDLPLTLRHRIDARCLDRDRCTIANAEHESGPSLGVLALGARGVSRTFIWLILDPAVHPWAKAGQEYRARLTDLSAAIAAELDDYHDRPKEHERLKRMLRKIAKESPAGLDTVWQVVTIVAPLPSQRKGYRSGSSGTDQRQPRQPRRKPAAPGAPPRYYNGRRAA